MRILISNDDGIFARGINTLASVLSELGEVTVVAPDRNRSGASNSLTLDYPLRIREEGERRVSVEGTPTDCVHFALNEWLAYRPDVVVAGVNHGANLGDDVLYSGTVAAATEGHFLGVPAIAVSLVGDTHFETAAQVVKQILQNMQTRPLPTNKILNVNVPDVPMNELGDWQVTRLGARHRAENMVKGVDPRGKPLYWLGPPGACQDAGPGTDFYAIEQRCVSITPLQVDLTAHDSLGAIREWIHQEKN
ncbi:MULTISPECIES: 5'/3'-nucleotidase SurE [Photobacterium]|uniref:5'-nucleotidase SurE n=1 Tax=Photobacterium ganghwense TaxID=320778 RepID=A0A0J1H404_9GAMM|nr:MULTISPECIES: 5'/3'-nucleotidase SurE [Photobacterium]KLV06518.1 stationary phase survival protein SurE [Photobacterium ganghwense]MBV1840386.1 5'/3'-nucleotidase SurE [Photobacterium ganghwense]PSU06598.1 5'/3'-nucleotidase SurE [Photobacterium ganghwense]QSV14563.1 5'/3'-nucleotidase SurE [Photobacterium ganghwense]